MTITRKTACLVYALCAVVALIGTWGNNIAYLKLDLGFVGTNLRFWQETLANPASRSITVDLFLLMLAAVVWMLMEAKRLSMRWAWLYVLFGALIAISFTFPIFMINRERALAKRDPSGPAGTLSAGDVLGLLGLAVVSVAYAAASLMR